MDKPLTDAKKAALQRYVDAVAKPYPLDLPIDLVLSSLRHHRKRRWAPPPHPVARGAEDNATRVENVLYMCRLMIAGVRNIENPDFPGPQGRSPSRSGPSPSPSPWSSPTCRMPCPQPQKLLPTSPFRLSVIVRSGLSRPPP